MISGITSGAVTMPLNSIRPRKRLHAVQGQRNQRAERRREGGADHGNAQAEESRGQQLIVREQAHVPARGEASPERDETRVVERIDHDGQDRHIQQRIAKARDAQQQQATGASSPRLLLAILEVLEPEDRRDQQEQQHDRYGGGDGPVAADEELIPQNAADHQRICAAEQRRNRELADRGNEHQQASADDAGH